MPSDKVLAAGLVLAFVCTAVLLAHVLLTSQQSGNYTNITTEPIPNPSPIIGGAGAPITGPTTSLARFAIVTSTGSSNIIDVSSGSHVSAITTSLIVTPTFTGGQVTAYSATGSFTATLRNSTDALMVLETSPISCTGTTLNSGGNVTISLSTLTAAQLEVAYSNWTLGGRYYLVVTLDSFSMSLTFSDGETQIKTATIKPIVWQFQYGELVNGLQIYADADATVPLTSYNWSTIAPGGSRTLTMYLKNTGTTTFATRLTTSDWVLKQNRVTLPATYQRYFNVTWDFEDVPIAPQQIATAHITLRVLSNITSVTDFAFNMIIGWYQP